MRELERSSLPAVFFLHSSLVQCSNSTITKDAEISQIAVSCEKYNSADSRAHRSDLHLSRLQRIMIASHRVPLHAVGVRRVRSSEVETVEVGRMTGSIPPSTLVRDGTRTCRVDVVVLVARAELLTAVPRQRVAFNRKCIKK